MHDYVTNLSNRTRVLALMMTLSAIFFLATGLVLQTAKINLPFWLNAPSTAALFSALFAVYDRYAWRWRVFGKQLSTVPVLDGFWAGTVVLRSELLTEESAQTLPCHVHIKQTWTKMRIEFETEFTTSCSWMAALNEPGHGPGGLRYEYQVTPKPGYSLPEVINIHSGTAYLLPKRSDWTELAGEFYNGPGYQRYGEYTLARLTEPVDVNTWLMIRRSEL